MPSITFLCVSLLGSCCLLSNAVLLHQNSVDSSSRERSFSIQGPNFIFEDKGVKHPVQIHAGEVHYFRVPEIYWEDRLMRLAAMGLNAVSTYVPWNWHEQKQGVYDFSSERKNLTKYVEIAANLGLLVIIRVGPYICAEWDFGGLPAWLLKHTLRGNMTFRTSHDEYLTYVDQWWSQLLPKLRPQLVEEGGPVAMVQLENEFGHFGDASNADKAYFDRMHSIARRELGPNVLLITTDSGGHNTQGLGTLPRTTPSTLSAINLGPWYEPNRHLLPMLAEASRYNSGGPTLVMELWSGWFQTWEKSRFTETHFQQPTSDLLKYVRLLLEKNASFTLYMAHGGTNFGFWNSASGLTQNGNLSTSSFITTSYDYAAPISEEGSHGHGGDGGDKFTGLQFLLSKHRGSWEPPMPKEPTPPVLATYRGDAESGAVSLSRRVPLYDESVLAALCEGGWTSEPSGQPTPMEFHDQQAGLALYRFRPSLNQTAAAPPNATVLLQTSAEVGSFLTRSEEARGILKLKARDRITVWSAGKLLMQAQNSTNYGLKGKLGPIQLVVPMGKHHKNATNLDILVEHLGRRAFAKRRASNLDPESYVDWKGLRGAWLGGHQLQGGWQFCGLPLADLYAWNGSVPRPSKETPLEQSPSDGATGPAFFEGRFNVTGEPADTFLKLDAGAWRTGAAYMNGFNLGRYHYDSRGPFDFYVPKSALRRGSNTVVMLEMEPRNMTLTGVSIMLKAERGAMISTGAPGA